MNNIDKIFATSNNILSYSKRYFEYLNKILNNIDLKDIEVFVKALINAREKGSTIYFIGNGGSAATASHFANDISIGTRTLDKPFRAISLTDNNAIITAVGNDDGFEEIFYQQVKVHLKRNDLLVAISASGNSINLIKSIEYANSIGATTFALTSFDGGKMKKIATHQIHVPSDKGEYGPAEDAHMILDHLVSNYLLRHVINNK